MRNKKQSIVLSVCVAFLLSISLFVLAGCSDNSLVGIWARVDKENVTMAFYSDNTCHNTGIRTQTSADPVSWSIKDDGLLVFTMEWDGPIDYKKAETKEEALNNRNYYYLDGNTLVLRKQEYIRKR